MSTEDGLRQLRIELMQTQIDNGRVNIERLRQEIRTENRKFAVQLLIAAAGLLVAGVAIGRFIFFHS